MKYLGRSIGAGILSLILLAGMGEIIGGMETVSAEEGSGEFKYATSLRRPDPDGSGQPGDIDSMLPVENGDRIENGDAVYFVVEPDMTTAEAGMSQEIPLPEGLVPVGGEQTMPLTLTVPSYRQEADGSWVPENVTVRYGTMTWNRPGTENTVLLTFQEPSPQIYDENGTAQTLPLEGILDAYMGIEAELAADADMADEQGRIEITLPGYPPQTVTVTVPSLEPAGPVMEKTAGAPGGLPDGRTLLPVQPTAAWTSEEIGGGDQAGQEQWTLTCTFPDGEGQELPSGAKIQITYETQLDTFALTDIWTDHQEAVYTNEAQALPASVGEPVVKAEAVLTLPEDWADGLLEKEYGEELIKIGEDRYIRWTVTVRAYGETFRELKVVDTMGKALSLQDALAADGTIRPDLTDAKDAVTVAGDSGELSPDQFDMTYERGADGKDVLTIWLIGGSTGSGAAVSEQTYTITYQTKVDPEKFCRPGPIYGGGS